MGEWEKNATGRVLSVEQFIKPHPEPPVASFEPFLFFFYFLLFSLKIELGFSFNLSNWTSIS